MRKQIQNNLVRQLKVKVDIQEYLQETKQENFYLNMYTKKSTVEDEKTDFDGMKNYQKGATTVSNLKTSVMEQFLYH